jgi:hypothetical protein
MCGSGPDTRTAEDHANRLKAVTPAPPSERQETAKEIKPVEGLRKRQTLAARLGVQQLRRGFTNPN